MMKPRSNRITADPAPSSSRIKSAEQTANGLGVSPRNQAQANQQPTSAQTIRKRRSSINVYDQPSSLNSRLRQLETDMLRLDEDRTKLYDDTHAALAQYELKLGEIHAILKSRQDNVEKYVEDMRMLLQAKEEFEQQAKMLNEKNDRIHEKFMHRETTISREIKLLKNKFELLEKNRQFRSILQKSSASADSQGSLIATATNAAAEANLADDLNSGLGDYSASKSKQAEEDAEKRAEASSRATKNVRIKLSKMDALSWLVRPLFQLRRNQASKKKQRRNRVSTISASKLCTETPLTADNKGAPGDDATDSESAGALAANSIGNNELTPATSAGKTRAAKKTSLIGRLFWKKTT